MLSLKHKFLFIHIPRTGGNSIQNHLRQFSEDNLESVQKGPNDTLHRFEVINRRLKTTKHSPLSYYRDVLRPKVFAGLFKFTVIRNPWDRLVSYHLSPHSGRKSFDRKKFKELIQKLTMARYFIALDDHRLGDDVDFVIKFENLQAGFNTACRKIGIRAINLPRVNVAQTKKRHYSTYYDDELREMVRKRFAEEIRLGRYSFTPLGA